MPEPAQRKTSRTTEITLRPARASVAELLAAPGSKQAALLLIGGLDLGDSIPIRDGGATLLGRDPECDGIIRDDGISWHHARIESSSPGAYEIIDLDSTNGVFVEGRRVSRHRLREGDRILLGRRTILKFVLHDKVDLLFQRQLYDSSVRDTLTGAFNRRHFDERIRAEMAFAKRHEARLSLLMIDLDRFKKINDAWGHLIGDEVLALTAKTIAAGLRQEDLLARYGGEEFAVIGRDISAMGALAFAERLRADVERLKVRTDSGERIHLTISIGAATAPRSVPLTAERLIEVADKNLYRAKYEGRNRVVATEITEA